jgi:hypothetical protein
MRQSRFRMDRSPFLATGRRAAGLIVACCAAVREARAMDSRWGEMRALEDRLREAETSLEENGIALGAIGEMIPSAKTPWSR